MSTVSASRGLRPRIAGDDRRNLLLDVATAMVASAGLDRVSMDSVAAAAGVSRALVYKHFVNRDDLLAALYARESARLHAQLARAVAAQSTLAGMLRALVLGVVAAQSEQAATLAVLQATEARGPGQRRVQSSRDRATLAHFTDVACAEFDVDREAAREILTLGLSSISVVLRQWRTQPTASHAARLADRFVAMVVGGLTFAANG